MLDEITQTPTKTGTTRRTREAILEAATTLFAEKGYDGANLNEIVARAQTTKPMIYYHFSSKEGLFAAVLEAVYAGMREIEATLHLDSLNPVDAIKRLIAVTFRYHADNPDWIRLIAVANIHDAQHIQNSATIASKNAAVLDLLQTLLRRGAAEGCFRADVDALDLHQLINSFCFHRVSNRHTWRVIFPRKLDEQEDAARQLQMLTQAVLAFLQPPILQASVPQAPVG